MVTSNKSIALVAGLIVVVSVVFVGGCKDDTAANGGAGLKLYCGAGIRPPTDELIEAFSNEYGITVSPDYRGSEILLSSIKVSHRGDLYMPGDRLYVDKAEQAGFVLSRKQVAYWIPTILVQKGNPKGISSLEDLLREDVRTGLGDPTACAIGKISQKIFEKNGMAWGQVEDKIDYKSLTVNDLGTQIQTKSLDAVIIWDSLAQYYGKYGDAMAIAPEQNFISGIDIAVLKFTGDREAAERFAEFLTSEKAEAILNKHNYATKPPETP